MLSVVTRHWLARRRPTCCPSGLVGRAPASELEFQVTARQSTMRADRIVVDPKTKDLVTWQVLK